jgi:hypothetical protein
MEKIINLLINNWTKGVDTYTHNGSTWLIFSESKQWVIELTESKTLWYNYNFFKELFSLTSMDVVDNQHYITKWVEDNLINKVKDTILEKNITEGEVEEIIENGVKLTQFNDNENKSWVEGVIKKGVRHTLNTEYMPTSMVEDIIENGVKETHDDSYHHKGRIDGVIKNGVKETKTPGKDGDIMSTIEWMEENKSTSYTKMIDDVIEKGVKETKACYYKDPKTNLMFIKWDYQIDNVIETGIKEGKINDIIDNRVKVSGTFVGGNRQKENIESVIGYGTKNPTV